MDNQKKHPLRVRLTGAEQGRLNANQTKRTQPSLWQEKACPGLFHLSQSTLSFFGVLFVPTGMMMSSIPPSSPSTRYPIIPFRHNTPAFPFASPRFFPFSFATPVTPSYFSFGFRGHLPGRLGVTSSQSK